MSMLDNPVPFLIPLGVILAACITAIISFLSLIISKEQKTSEFRQTWIDGFRHELAEFAGHARRISTETTLINLPNLNHSATDFVSSYNENALRTDPFAENRLCMAQSYYALRFRLNPSEEDHKNLLTYLNKVYESLNQSVSDNQHSETIKELDEMSFVAQKLLKNEWIRVKNGEKAFRISVAIAKWVIIIFFISILLWFSYRFVIKFCTHLYCATWF